jgi:hypothetical protein
VSPFRLCPQGAVLSLYYRSSTYALPSQRVPLPSQKSAQIGLVGPRVRKCAEVRRTPIKLNQRRRVETTLGEETGAHAPSCGAHTGGNDTLGSRATTVCQGGHTSYQHPLLVAPLKFTGYSGGRTATSYRSLRSRVA